MTNRHPVLEKGAGAVAGLILLILAALGTSAARAEPTPASPGLWHRDGDRITFTTARFSFPAGAGVVALVGAYEFSRPGEGLDSGLQYESADREVFASVYVYAPSLAHEGVTAFATDNAIRVQSGSDLRLLNSRVVSAGGRDGVAIRADYSGFRQGRGATSAAFIRAGAWIIKLRVSGPEARRPDVEATMAALLANLRFEGSAKPWLASPLNVSDCANRPDHAAPVVPHTGADTLEDAVFDASNATQTEPRHDPPGHEVTTELDPNMCLSARAHVGNSTVSILRATTAGRTAIRTVLLALLTDSGTLIEVMENRERHVFVMYYHQIGTTYVLGRYGAIPTDEQIVNIVSGADHDGGNIRATITYPGNGNSSITINERLTTPASPAS
jgi:hypothetical protein